MVYYSVGPVQVEWSFILLSICGCGSYAVFALVIIRRLRLKYDGTHAETRFRLSAKRKSPLNRWERQFSRLLAAEVCASAVVVLDTPSSEVL